MLRFAVLGSVFGLASCVQPAPPAPQSNPKFTVGYGYQSQGEWRYPRIFNNYDVTGLANVQTGSKAMTADGEAYDPQALAAASPVLQLPGIVTITNLVNGYTMDVRVNDRGPDNPGRVLAVTPRVASLLRFPAEGVVEVRVVLKSQQTDALDAALGQALKMTAAPVAGISAQSLGPPGSSGTGAAQNLTPRDQAQAVSDPGRLSGIVTAYPPAPGPLYVQIPGFGRVRDTRDTINALYPMPAFVEPVFDGDRTLYAVRLGPYHAVAEADSVLRSVLRRGVADPEIIVR